MQINQQFNMFEPRQNWKPYALKIVMYVRKIAAAAATATDDNNKKPQSAHKMYTQQT